MLRIERIKKSYPGFALEVGPLEIGSREVVALLGPNGAGKTTLMRSVLGINRSDILEATIDGASFGPETTFQRTVIGYAPEEPIFFENDSLGQFLKFVSGFYTDWDAELAKRLLDRFNLDSRKKLKALSKGMRTKVSLVVAFAHHADILFLDEPTSGLDPVSKEEFWAFVGSSCEAGRIQSAVIASHQLEEVHQFCNRAVFLSAGRVMYDKRNFSKEQLRELFGESIQSIGVL
jgi:ABC-2 type transport system ATP-binding protein